MADCSAAYNGYTFSNGVNPVVRKNPHVLDTGAVDKYTVEIEFSAFVACADYSAWNTARNAIDAALQTPGQTLAIKDAQGSPNTLWSFGSADCLGDGPYVEYSYEEQNGYCFMVNVSVRGDIEPGGGSGTPVDTYEDRYAYDQQGRITYTRTGTQRKTSAYADQDAAITATKPTLTGTWELLRQEVTLDEDKKECQYTYEWIEPFEELPAQFAKLEYNITHGKDGKRDDVNLSATAGVNFDSGKPDGLEDTLLKWAKSKLPKGTKIANTSTDFNKRDGTCSCSITGVAPVSGDIVEESESSSQSVEADYVIRKRLGGGGGWKQTIGDDSLRVVISGFRVGLTKHPPAPPMDRSDRKNITEHDPQTGPDGKLLYRIDYSYEKEILMPADGAAGGGGGGRGSPPSGSSPGSTFSTSGTIGRASGGLFGVQSGFSTGGTMRRATGGLFG